MDISTAEPGSSRNGSRRFGRSAVPSDQRPRSRCGRRLLRSRLSQRNPGPSRAWFHGQRTGPQELAADLRHDPRPQCRGAALRRRRRHRMVRMGAPRDTARRQPACDARRRHLRRRCWCRRLGPLLPRAGRARRRRCRRVQRTPARRQLTARTKPSGSARLTVNWRIRSGNPERRPRALGSIVMRTRPLLEPLTNHSPRHPCTPHPKTGPATRVTSVSDDLGTRAANAHPPKTHPNRDAIVVDPNASSVAARAASASSAPG